jgi:hypothetical protein
VERVRVSFLLLHRNTQGGQGGNWMLSASYVRDWLSSRPYKFQLLQELKPNEGPRPRVSCTDVLSCLEDDYLFSDTIVFSNEATFHLSGKANHRNLIIWGSQNPHRVVKHMRDECFLCCKQSTVLLTFVLRRDYHYGSRVRRHAEALPCATAGCKHCDLTTRRGPPPYRRNVTRTSTKHCWEDG